MTPALEKALRELEDRGYTAGYLAALDSLSEWLLKEPADVSKWGVLGYLAGMKAHAPKSSEAPSQTAGER